MQLALAIVVLVGAGLCIRSLRNLLAIDPGYRTDDVLIVPLDLDEKKYDEARGQALQIQRKPGDLPKMGLGNKKGFTPRRRKPFRLNVPEIGLDLTCRGAAGRAFPRGA